MKLTQKFKLLKVAAPALLCALAISTPVSRSNDSFERKILSTVKNANGGYAIPAYATQRLSTSTSS